MIEIALFTAGPLGGRYLADLGAEVIKIEQPGGETGKLTVEGKETKETLRPNSAYTEYDFDFGEFWHANRPKRLWSGVG